MISYESSPLGMLGAYAGMPVVENRAIGKWRMIALFMSNQLVVGDVLLFTTRLEVLGDVKSMFDEQLRRVKAGWC